jgi:hypothetical protein
MQAQSTSAMRSRRIARALKNADMAIEYVDDLQIPEQPAPTTDQPLFEGLGKSIETGILLTRQLFACLSLRDKLDQLEEYLDKYGDSLSDQEKADLNARAEKAFDTLAKSCPGI